MLPVNDKADGIGGFRVVGDGGTAKEEVIVIVIVIAVP
jgi:hypothetical protein